MVYQLVPMENAKADNEASFRTIMAKFAYGHAGSAGVYLDEENRRRLNNIKLAHVNAALSLSGTGHPEMARQVLEQFDKNVSEENFPYGMTTNLGNRHDVISAQFLQACYQAQDAPLAVKVSRSLRQDLTEQMSYYKSLGDGTWGDEILAREAYQVLQGKPSQLSDQQSVFAADILSSFQLLQQLDLWEKKSLETGLLRKQ
jgi:hypothetical protein